MPAVTHAEEGDH